MNKELKQFVKELNRLKEYASINRFNLDKLNQISEGLFPPAGDDDNYIALYYPEKIKVVFSYEHHPQKNGSLLWLRHLSISINNNAIDENKNKEIFDLITSTLEMSENAWSVRCLKYIENWDSGSALNIIAPPNFGVQ